MSIWPMHALTRHSTTSATAQADEQGSTRCGPAAAVDVPRRRPRPACGGDVAHGAVTAVAAASQAWWTAFASACDRARRCGPEVEQRRRRPCRRCGGSRRPGSARRPASSAAPSTPPTDSRPSVMTRMTSGAALTSASLVSGRKPSSPSARARVDGADRLDHRVAAGALAADQVDAGGAAQVEERDRQRRRTSAAASAFGRRRSGPRPAAPAARPTSGTPSAAATWRMCVAMPSSVCSVVDDHDRDARPRAAGSRTSGGPMLESTRTTVGFSERIDSAERSWPLRVTSGRCCGVGERRRDVATDDVVAEAEVEDDLGERAVEVDGEDAAGVGDGDVAAVGRARR